MTTGSTHVHSTACPTPKPHSESRSESRREHEFYRYYEPIRYMTENGPSYCNVRDAQAREQHKPFSCPDKTLTAFCQLGALRFNARRCMLFFFDTNYAYVLAEATRSLSLENDNAHDENDHLWLGHSKIPRNVACCEVTVALPSFPSTSSTMSGDRDSVFIVPDLETNPQTKDKPYVTGFPNSRFYAGVPITSASGINIGAYCILGDEPRDGVLDKDIMFLRDMSRTVMTHLETVRAQSERQRATQMVTGLGSFVKQSSDTRRYKRHRRHTSRATDHPGRRLARNQGLIHESTNPVPQDEAVTASHSSQSTPFSNNGQSQQGSSKLPPEPPDPQPDTTAPKLAPNQQNSALKEEQTRSSHKEKHGIGNSYARPPLRKTESMTTFRPAYQKAAEIMCDSLSVDGVAFLDSSVHAFGGLAESIDSTDSGDLSLYDDSESARSRSVSPTSEAKSSSCEILGCAENLANGTAGVTQELPLHALTESFLRRLLRRHPHGKIWSFSDRGQAHSEDALSSGDDGLNEPDAAEDFGSQQRRRRFQESREDGEALANMLPGVRSVAIHGVRDPNRRRWTAGCILWSFDPLRVLTTGTEMNFTAAFCDIIAGETRRLEIQRSDKAKSDFISSISHELRSPLHGILGSTEVLGDIDGLDSASSSLVAQIDSCGRTLLDCLDHLLDFATLKSQRLRQGIASSSKIGKRLALKENKASMDDGLATLEKSVALDDLTEEAVDSTVYSFLCKKGVNYQTETSVILDIDRSHGMKWLCKLATGGWRRVCINLITNALKYTPSGYVHISLKQQPRAGSRRQFDAILAVSDSGKGMSKEFMEHHLFRDFTQEDANADGIGLGMHMVGRILHAINGKIEVVSHQDGPQAGTSITVTVPLEHSPNMRNASDDANGDVIKPVRGIFSGLTVNIWDDWTATLPANTREEQLQSEASAKAVASVRQSCLHLGLEPGKNETADCNLDIIFETGYERANGMRNLHNNKVISSKRPVIVICKSNPAAKTLAASRDEAMLRTGAIVEYVALPCGVKTLSRAITSVLLRHKEFQSTMPLYNSQRRSESDVATTVDAQVEDSEIPPAIAPVLPNQDLAIRSVDRPTSSGHGLVQNTPGAEFSTPEQQYAASSALKKADTGHETSLFTPASVPSQAETTPALLLVDDNEVNLQLLTMYAKKRNYHYFEAMDGQVAVDTYQRVHEDLKAAKSTAVISYVLMDINMPVMDGYEATQRIRAYEKKHQLKASKIIALTALGSEEAHKEAFGSGCDLFLTKPVKLKDLTRIMESAQ